MSSVGGSGLNNAKFKNAIDKVAGDFEAAETALNEGFKNGATQTDLMGLQLKYQTQQARLQTLQETIKNSYETIREIIRNGMSIR